MYSYGMYIRYEEEGIGSWVRTKKALSKEMKREGEAALGSLGHGETPSEALDQQRLARLVGGGVDAAAKEVGRHELRRPVRPTRGDQADRLLLPLAAVRARRHLRLTPFAGR